MCTGFPRLGVLRRLRPAPTRSADDGPSPTTRVGYTASGQDRGGSRVHCDSLDEGGAQLCPCGLATATPQHFTVASRTDTHMTCPEVPRPDPPARVRTAPGPYPPGLSRFTFRGT